MSNIVNLKAQGLYTFPNDLSENPPGALREALNVIIDRNSVIESRRGLAQWGTEFGISTDRAKQLIEYKNRILFHYDSKLGYDSDGNGTLLEFNGDYSEPETGIRIKSIEANGNLYFTSSEGIKKISANNASDFSTLSGYITQSGGAKALNIDAMIDYSTGGFFLPLSKVGYVVVWGIVDNNDNLILGTPSSRTVIENISSEDSAVVDLEFSIPTEVTNENFFYQIYRTAIFSTNSLANLDLIDPGYEMNLVIEEFVTSADITNGTISITDITPEDFRQNGTLLYTNPVSGEGLEQSNEPPPFAKDITLYKGYTFYGNTFTVQRFNFSLLSISQLVSETSTITIDDGVTSRVYTFVGDYETFTVDFSGMSFPGGKAALDGKYFTLIAANDLRVYKIWFDNTGTTVEPTLVGTIGIKVDISGVADAASDIAEATGIAILDATNDFNISESSGVLTTECSNNGYVTIAPTENIGASFSISTDGNGKGEDTSSQEIFLPKIPITGENGPSVAQQIDQCARSIIKVINADTSKVVKAFYLSGINDVPGQMLLEHVDITGPTFYLTADSTNTGSQFNPNLPTSGTSVSSENEVNPNRVYYSKYQQPEAVPLLNYIDIGPKDEQIQRIIALRDSLFIFKEDAIYRLTGEVAPFSVSAFDSSAILLAPDSAVVLNNLIHAFSTQGVITVSDTGVSVISRPIEDSILSIIRDGFNYYTASFAVSYETDRSYLLWTVTNINDTVATQCFRYNSFTNSWTKWDVTATCGIVNRHVDKLFIGPGDLNFIERERKDRTRYDYADREYDITVITDEVNSNVVKMSSVSNVDIGDVILQLQYLTITQFNRLLSKLDLDQYLDDSDYLSELRAVPGNDMSVKMTALVNKLNIDDTSLITETFDPADVDTGNDLITINNHGIVNNTIVYFTNSVSSSDLPGGISAGQKYYIISATTNTFQLSLTEGGSAIDITSQGSNTHTVSSDYYFSGTSDFETMQTEFNDISEKLSFSSGTFFTNFPTSTGVAYQESVVDDFESSTTTVTFRLPVNFIAGIAKVYKSISTKVTWDPVFFGDVSLTKQVRSGTIIFENNNFSSATVSYATDNSPAFEGVEFNGDGIGDWGQFPYSEQYWGGISSAKPFRTLIPLQKQRCRYISPRFEHNTALEKYSLYGMSLTFRMISPRGYK